MRGLERLPEPSVLADNREDWTERYLARVADARAKSTKPPRPPSAQYAHAEIVAALRAMSFGKCFYCEQSLGDGEHEVDHYIEIGEDPSGAFRWLNLYLSCRGCNDKQPNRIKPALACLDPCDPEVQPEEHLTFEDEMICARNASPAGYSTIQKYGLHRDELNLKRSRQLRRFDRALRAVHEKMITDGRKERTNAENEILGRFAQKDHPFSLMFSVHLAAHGL